MTIRSRDYLKNKYKTGDIPTGDDYSDFIDSFYSKAVTGAVYDRVVGNINGFEPDANGVMALSIPAPEKSIVQASHGFSHGTLLCLSGASYVPTLASRPIIQTAPVGIVSEVVDGNTFKIISSGYLAGFDSLVPGTTYYVSDTVTGGWTSVAPTAAASAVIPIFIAESVSAGFFNVVPYQRHKLHSNGTRMTDTPNMNFVGSGVSLTTSGNTTNVNIAYNAAASGTAVWGGITGSLYDQTDLMTTIVSAGGLWTPDAQDNLAAGRFALMGTQGQYGQSNVAIGVSVMTKGVSGGNNIGVGFNALHNNIARNNMAFGESSGYDITSGIYNICLGDFAGRYLTTGSFNTLLGPYTGYDLPANASNYLILDSISRLTLGQSSIGNSPIVAVTSEDMLVQTVNVNGVFTVNGAPVVAQWSPDAYGNLKAGTNVMTNVTSGANNNIALGREAYSGADSSHKTDGDYNVVIGYQAMAAASGTPMYKVAIGYVANGVGRTGEDSTYIGREAGYYTSGDNNLFIGAYAGANQINVSNRIIIDTVQRASIADEYLSAPISVSADASMSIQRVNVNGVFTVNGAVLQGGSSVSATYAPTLGYMLFSTVVSGTPTTINVSPTAAYFNATTGNLSCTTFTSLSDRNQKDNIANILHASDIIYQLQGVSFNWKSTGNKAYGVVAQDLEEVIPEAVTTTEGQKSVDYNQIIAFLIESNKELQDRMAVLEGK